MFYVYVLRSRKDGKWYTGSTHDLRKRFSEHSNNKVFSTKGRGLFELIYFEGSINEQDARVREKYLKTGPVRNKTTKVSALPSARISNGAGMGKRYLRNRLKRFLSR